MERFLVFSGSDYYPSGGFQDFVASFASEAEAVAYALGRVQGDCFSWAHVADIETGTIINDLRKEDAEP